MSRLFETRDQTNEKLKKAIASSYMVLPAPFDGVITLRRERVRALRHLFWRG